MLRSLGGIGGILVRCWPGLLAWYLAGNLVRASVIAVAAPIGPESPLAALLLLPIVVLARLVSYVGMFLVLRRALTNYRSIAGGDVEFLSFRDAVSEFVRVLVVSIGPFFTLYAILGLLNEDLKAYASAAFRYSFDHGGEVLDVGDGPLVLAVVVIAFGGRWLLKVFSRRLPEWTGIPGVYLEATWVFVALTAIGSLFGPILEWVANRQVVHWVANAREWLSGLWEPIRLAFLGLDWALPVAVQMLLLPLAWLLIAGIIYLRSLANVLDDAAGTPRGIAARLGVALQRLPPALRRWRHLATGSWNETGRPVVFAGRVIRRLRPADLAVFLGAYAVLHAGAEWLERGLYAIIGPHGTDHWFTFSPVVALAVSALAEPVRVVLLATAFDAALGRWSAWQESQGASSSLNTSAASSLTERSSVAAS